MLNRYEFPLMFANQSFILGGDATLYWPKYNYLIVADLHLEKGSYFALRGNPLPLYDSLQSLQNLKSAIAYFKPKTILSLGDNIHDPGAFSRMQPATKQLLTEVLESVHQWVWINGNHDRDAVPFAHSHFVFAQHLKKDNIIFCHEKLAVQNCQVIGHFHPKVRRKSITGKCFVAVDDTLLMPSFGTYTGGLDVESAALQEAINHKKSALFIVYKKKIWQIS